MDCNCVNLIEATVLAQCRWQTHTTLMQWSSVNICPGVTVIADWALKTNSFPSLNKQVQFYNYFVNGFSGPDYSLLVKQTVRPFSDSNFILKGLVLNKDHSLLAGRLLPVTTWSYCWVATESKKISDICNNTSVTEPKDANLHPTPFILQDKLLIALSPNLSLPSCI